jgi:hypothetical protein
MSLATPKAAHMFERDPDNWYQEEAWTSQRLFAVERFEGRVIDPCAGSGTIVKNALDAGLRAEGYDLRYRGFPDVTEGVDFFRHALSSNMMRTDNIVSNPPYGRWSRNKPEGVVRERIEEEFLRLALELARHKVALFLPTVWMTGAERGRWMETLPLYRVYNLAPRPSCPPGTWLAAGNKAGNGTKDFSWFVFLKGFEGHATIHWLRRDDGKGKVAS